MPPPLTINNIHVFQIPCAVRDYEESIGFMTLENSLGDGYASLLLVGSAAGTREFRLTMPTLADDAVAARQVTGINGDALNYADYLWDLYCETRGSGKLFAIQSTLNDQFYLCRFGDERLTYQRMFSKLYSSGVSVLQRRVKGFTVFDPAKLAPTRWLDNTGVIGPDWVSRAEATSVTNLVKNGDIGYFADGPGGKSVSRLNSISNTGYFSSVSSGSMLYDAFLVLKVRTATFTQTSGILSGTTTEEFLKGENGTTKFANLGFSASTYEFRKNGALFEQTDQQAPIGVWGVVHLRFTGGIAFGAFQIGKNGNASGTHAQIDTGELVLAQSRNLTKQEARELTEALIVKWAIV